MTQLLPPEAHLLVVLGEVRGDVKGILRTQQDFSADLKALEARLGTKMNSLDDRVTALESYRLKVAGFTIGLAMFLTLTKDKLPSFLAFFTGG